MIATHPRTRCGHLALTTCLAALLAGWISMPWACADTGALTGAITAKEAEIRWKQQDLMNAHQVHSMLQGFLTSYPNSSAQLGQALEQLDETDSRLATIQQNNLTKLTITLGMETCKTVADTISIGTTASHAMITHGCAAAAGAVAWEKVQDKLQEGGRTALGVDGASLSSPRTVKLNATNAASRAAFPVLNGVHHQLQKSLEDIKAEVLVNEGVELGDTGAILRKNIIVREAINQAKNALLEIDRSAAEAKTDAEGQIDAAAQEVAVLQQQIEQLQRELAQLRSQLVNETRDAEILEARARITPETSLPAPDVTVTNEPEETYQQRLFQAQTDAALARWNAETPPLMQEIATLQNQITTHSEDLQQQINIAYTCGFDTFIANHLGAAPVAINQRASLLGLAAVGNALQEALEGVSNPAVLDNGLTVAGQLTNLYADLENKQNRLRELMDLVMSYTGVPGDPWPSLAVPGEGMQNSTSWEAAFQEMQALLPTALQNHGEAATQVDLYTQTLSNAVAATRVDIIDELAAAENALAGLANAARSYAGLIATLPEARDQSQPNAYGRAGIWTGSTDTIGNFDRIIDGSYSHVLYSMAMAERLQQPDGLAAAQELAARYRAVCAAMPAVRANYDRAWHLFEQTYSHLNQVMGPYSFPLGNDWNDAATLNPLVGAPTDTSSVVTRFERLHNSAHYDCWTDAAGNPWNGDGAIYSWMPLPRLGVLPDPESYNDTALITHRILAWREELALALTEWMPLPPDEFTAACMARWTAIGQLRDDMWDALMAENPGLYYVSTPFLGAHESAAGQALNDVWAVEQAYAAAHGAPVVTAVCPDAMHEITPGQTVQESLWVQAQGDFMTCQWQVTEWPYYESEWRDVPGATGLDLTTDPLDRTMYFRCLLETPGGRAVAGPISVYISIKYPPLVITSAASAQATLGQPWLWQLTSTPTASWWSSHGMDGDSLPPGVVLNPESGLLSGTPTRPGYFTIPIIAFAPDAEPGFQELFVSVVDPTPKPAGFATWFEATAGPVMAADPVLSGLFANPSGDGMPNLLKFALGLDPRTINAHQALAMRPSAPGLTVLEFRKLNSAGSVAIAIESAPAPSGPWATWTPPPAALTEQVGPTHTAVEVLIPVDAARMFFRLAATSG